MNRVAHAHQGETLDALLYRVYGKTADITEQALQLNPHLVNQGPVLQEGTPVTLPPPPKARDTSQPPIQLWN
ncbi:tail protein X [Vreelandella venusta]|uniref:Phage tail protein n=1 Tax=Vreelandella venusta TaxID=44935 RepID=A0ABX2B9M0_9GAMM|nr:tail protein X [Halomonas venusta]AZM95162.1 phage tail protein [Halomonas venusta]NPT29673.1 phage tail protein [Halomonas venusta]